MVERYGYTRIEPRVLFRHTLMGDMDLNLVWMDEIEMLTDLAQFISRHEDRRFEGAARRHDAVSA